MNIDIKTEIRTALLANAALVALLGGNRVYQLAAPDANQYPRITFFEVTNFDSGFADDGVFAEEVIVQIDVWSKGSTSAISSEIDNTMKELGYFRSTGQDLYESDVQVYHKSLRYRKQVFEN